MSSTNKTSLGLNMWEASDKPVRQDFVNDNVIIDEKITKLNSDLVNVTNKHTAAFPQGDRLHLQKIGNIGFFEILKNSSATADYGTIVSNYMQDGSRTELVINATGIHASKIDNSGNIISSKIIVAF